MRSRPSGCRSGSSTALPHWYDAVAALVYVTHFVSIPLVTAVVWFCLRDRFAAWLAAVLDDVTSLGMAGYVVYPAGATLAGRRAGRDRDASTASPTSAGSASHLDVGRPADRSSGQAGSNPVAAMPSLHAGAALLVALFLWPSVARVARPCWSPYAAGDGADPRLHR